MKLAPVFSEAGLCWITIVEEDCELLCGERMEFLISGGGPPGDATLRETLQAEPVTGSVVDEQLDGGGGSIAEDKAGAGERILIETAGSCSQARSSRMATVELCAR